MSDAIVTTFDWRNDESVSTAVVRAIAELEGIDALQIEPLHRTIDTEALDAIFATTGEPDGPPEPIVSFTFRGYWVCVSWTGEGKLFDDERPGHGVSEEVA